MTELQAGRQLLDSRKRCLLVRLVDKVIVPDEDDRETIFRAGIQQGSNLFFQHLRIRADGGLGKRSNAELFYTKARVATAVVALCFTAFNAYTIISNFFVCLFNRQLAGSQEDFVLFLDETSDASKRLFWRAQVVVASIEVAALMAMLLYSIHVLVMYNCCIRNRHCARYRIWHQLYTVCCQIVPSSGNFSAMKTLQFLNPQVLGTHLSLALTKVEEGHSYQRVFFAFITSRLILGSLGFSAFAIKFAHLVVQLTGHMSRTRPGTYSAWDSVVQVGLLFGFVNQFFGITEIAEVEKLRLFLFIFGGEDSAMQAGEVDRQEAFLASVVHHICTELYVELTPRERRFRRAVALLSYTHLDVQRMVLEEDESREVDATTLRAQGCPRSVSSFSTTFQSFTDGDLS